ncbi:MAG: TolC family protein [Deltaproteobacteria bacterium]|nr:MAG: TolC family protein [Deltaproteobacteria bacterium]
MKRITSYLVVTLAVLGFLFSGGERGGAFTLKEAVEFGIAHNPALRGVKKGVEVKEEEVGIATSYHLPRVTLSSRYVKTDSPADVFGLKLNRQELAAADFAGIPDSFNNPPSYDTYVSTLEVQVPLFVPKVLAGRGVAKKDFEAERETFLREAEKLARGVVKAFVGVLTAKGYLTAAESALADAREHLKIAEKMVEVGTGLQSDVLRASVFLSRAEEGKVRASNGLAVAKEALKVAMGSDEDVSVEGGFSLDDEVKPLDYYVGEALKRRRDLVALRKRVEMAKRGVRYEQADYLPSVAAFGQVEVNGSSSPFDDDADAYRVGVALSWDLFDGLGRERRVRKAKKRAEQVRDFLASMENTVRFEVKRAYLELESAKARWEIAKNALKSAEEGVRLIRGRYENSLARMVELLDAQSALDAARADEVKARNDYYLALADLYAASGLLLEKLDVTIPGEVEE